RAKAQIEASGASRDCTAEGEGESPNRGERSESRLHGGSKENHLSHGSFVKKGTLCILQC
ncbi:MAG: hypothetical protein Q4D60_04865, partial [Eubacteriales bacterium]|nr:hypothetical protein [Eubacteriales bacterium]